MNRKSIPLLLVFFAISALAQAEMSGKTADGCSYKIINGKYLTDCSGSKKGNDSTPPASSPPVTSYDLVPIRESSGAPQSALIPATSASLSVPASQPLLQSAIVVDREQILEKKSEKKFKENPYLGIALGSSTIRKSNAGSSMGLGASVGANIDDLLGMELNYSYTKQSLNLGLGQRLENSPTLFGSASDSNLSSHLFSADIHLHFTESYAKLRPYLGLGLGLKFSRLEELSNTSYYSPSAVSGSLSQQSLGASAIAGGKLKLSKKLLLAGSFRYFFPFARQTARIEANNSYIQNSTALTQADDELTGSSQYQILGGILYLF